MRLRYFDLAFLLTLPTLIAAMNVLKDGPARLIALGLYGGLWSLTVLPRLGGAVRFVASVLMLRATREEYYFFAWVVLTALAYVRALAYPELRSLVFISSAFFLSIVILAITVLRVGATASRLSYLQALLYSTHVYVLVNVIAYAAGLRGESDFVNGGDFGSARLLAIIGVNVDRTLFLLAPGITSFSVVAGASLCVATAGALRANGIQRVFNATMVWVALVSLLLADARGPLLFVAVMAVTYVAFLAGRDTRWASRLVLPMSSLFALLLLALLLTTAILNLTDLSRGGMTLSGREVVWLSAFTHMIAAPLEVAAGYGYMGHYISEVSFQYASLFGGWGTDAPEFFTLHNFALQLLFDLGFIGVVAVLLVLSGALNRLYLTSGGVDSSTKMLAAVFLLYTVASGATESAFSVYSFLTLAPPMLVIAYLVQLPSPAKRRR